MWGTNIGFGRMGREGKWFNKEEGDMGRGSGKKGEEAGRRGRG